MAGFVRMATTDEIAPGEAKLFEANETRMALFTVGGAYYAIEDTCTHMGGPLSEEFVEEHVVTCPRHGAKFDVKSGQVLVPPARIGVASYNVRVAGLTSGSSCKWSI